MGNNILNLYLTIEIRIVKENDKSEPVSNKDKVRIYTVWCGCSYRIMATNPHY